MTCGKDWTNSFIRDISQELKTFIPTYSLVVTTGHTMSRASPSHRTSGVNVALTICNQDIDVYAFPILDIFGLAGGAQGSWKQYNCLDRIHTPSGKCACTIWCDRSWRSFLFFVANACNNCLVVRGMAWTSRRSIQYDEHGCAREARHQGRVIVEPGLSCIDDDDDDTDDDADDASFFSFFSPFLRRHGEQQGHAVSIPRLQDLLVSPSDSASFFLLPRSIFFCRQNEESFSSHLDNRYTEFCADDSPSPSCRLF
jgi:hypothetical protein